MEVGWPWRTLETNPFGWSFPKTLSRLFFRILSALSLRFPQSGIPPSQPNIIGYSQAMITRISPATSGASCTAHCSADLDDSEPSTPTTIKFPAFSLISVVILFTISFCCAVGFPTGKNRTPQEFNPRGSVLLTRPRRGVTAHIPTIRRR